MKRFNPLKANAPSAPEPASEARVTRVPHTAAPEGRVTRVPQARVSTVTLTENKAKDGIELRFPQKPDEEILALLKAALWRWSGFNGCWYHRDTPENRAFAAQFLTPAPAADNVMPVRFSAERAFVPQIISHRPLPSWKARFLRQ